MNARYVRSFAGSVCLGLAWAAATGCSRPADAPAEAAPRKPPPEDKSVTRTLVEEVSGYRAAKQGQMMKEKIRDISAEHDAQMSAILDEKDPPASAPAK